MKNCLLFFLLLLINTQLNADHFPTTPPNTPGFPLYPVTSIKAHTIYEGDEVFIGYSPTRFPCLGATIPNTFGEIKFIQIDSNNDIEITVPGSADSICFDLDVILDIYQFYSLGILPVGTYNIQMYWTGTAIPFPLPPGASRLPLGENIQFEVLAPVVIPLFDIYSLIILGGILMFISFLYLRNNSKYLLLSMICCLLFSGNLSAKKFHIILSSNAGTPTAEDIVNQATTSPTANLF